MKGILSIGSILIFSLLFFSCEKQDIDRMDKQIIELEKNLTERGLRVSKDLYENEYDIILDDNKYLEILITLDDGNLLFLDRLILEIKFEQGQSVDVEFPSFEKVMQPNGLVKINKYTITKNVASINEYQQIRDSIDQSLGIPKNLDTINAKDSLENLILNSWISRKSDREFEKVYSEILNENPRLRILQYGCHDGGSNEDDGNPDNQDPSSGGCYSHETFYVPIYAYTSSGSRVRQGTFIIHVTRNNSNASVSTTIISSGHITPTISTTTDMGSYAYVSANGHVNWHVSTSFNVEFSNAFVNMYQDGYVEYDGFYTPEGFGYGSRSEEEGGGAYFGNHASSEND